MKLLFAFVLLSCSFLGGYLTSVKSGLKTEEELTVALSEPVASRSLAFAISVANEEHERQAGRQPAKSILEDALSQSVKSTDEQDLSKSLGDDVLGRKLNRFLTADRHSKEVPGSSLMVSRYLDELRADPNTGIAELSSALDRIPMSGFPLERSAVLITMASLPGSADAVRSRATMELSQNNVNRPDPSTAQNQEELNRALSSTPEMILPITAHQVFLKSTPDAHQALQGTIDGLVAQKDMGVRIAIATQFLETHPNLRGELTAALVARGVNPPMEQIPAGGNQ